MDILGLLVGQSLPWVLGSVWVRLLLTTDYPGRSAMVAGYGYLIGSLALTLWMRTLSALGFAFAWTSIGLPLLSIAALGFFLLLRAKRLPAVTVATPPVSRPSGIDPAKALWWLFLALIVVHLLLATLEIVWRPMFPWDAWSQWATKARVWYEFHRMTPFDYAWLWSGGLTYLDAAPHYPANLPLLEVWASVCLGRWDDSLVNLSSGSFAAALVLGFYGQLRCSGRGPLFAMLGSYAVISLPFLDTHIALAGYADFPLAVYFGLSAIALWQWSVSRDPAQAVLAFILAVACPLTKNPGWAWIATLIPMLLVTLVPKAGMRMVYAFWGAAALSLLVLCYRDLMVFGYHLQATYHPVWESLWQNFYDFANWNMLWIGLPALLFIARSQLLRPPLLAGTVTVATGLGFLFVVFSFTNAEVWVNDYSTVNRATLHLAPLLIYYLLCLGHASVESLRGSRPESSTADGLAR